MIEQINDLMYRAGLTAQGCWDSMDDYDREAILKFAELVVREVFAKIENERFEIYQPVKESVMKHFGVKE